MIEDALGFILVIVALTAIYDPGSLGKWFRAVKKGFEEKD